MLDFSTLKRDAKGKFTILNTSIGKYEELTALFEEGYDCPEAYKMAGVRGYSPMLAKELEEEVEQLKALTDPSNIIEEKFDGVRGIMQFFSQPTLDDEDIGFTRLFSRNISKKTGFYSELSDKLPHLRELNVPTMQDTILDGELFIDGLPFKEVSSTLNCLWEEAVDRQIEKGFVTFHAFDILRYQGIDMKRLPLYKRKKFLKMAIEEINSPYIVEVPYYVCNDYLEGIDAWTELYSRLTDGTDEVEYLDYLEDNKENYPEIYRCLHSLPLSKLTPLGYYELIVSTDGEGVIVKSINGKYNQKRGWEYSKIKAFLTRELIVIGFEEPTKEYKGKNPKNWAYYEDGIPVTKHYYNKQVGNLILGVCITPEEFIKLPKKKKFNITEMPDVIPNKYNYKVLEVCVCSGFDDEMREYFTRNKNKLIGSVIEVKANGLFKDTGAMRHPRFLRMRPDKSAEECLFKDHIN